jgi:hypothetical protein
METCGMNRVKLSVVFALGAGSLVLSVGAGGATELPPGPNRELVDRECQSCHDANMFVSTNRSRESWNSVIEEMISYGMRVDDGDRAKILDYLATALGPLG